MKKLILSIFLLVILLGSCIGEDEVTIKTEEISDQPSDTNNTLTKRHGVFDNAYNDHYTTIGAVSLEASSSDNGNLKLIFQEDAQIQAGPSTYILLSNSFEPPYAIKTNGQERTLSERTAQIHFDKLSESINGFKEYEVPEGIKMSDYKYVVLYCTFGPVFGYAELN